MKKSLVAILIVLICLALVLAVVMGVRSLLLFFLLKAMGPRDWSVPLPGGYEIQRLNSRSIVLAEPFPDGHSDIVIHSYINAYWCDQRYIGLWCAKDGPEDLLGVAPEADSFYLIDSLEKELHGPLDPDAYEALCLQLQLSSFDQWTKTAPHVPPDAVF